MIEWIERNGFHGLVFNRFNYEWIWLNESNGMSLIDLILNKYRFSSKWIWLNESSGMDLIHSILNEFDPIIIQLFCIFIAIGYGFFWVGINRFRLLWEPSRNPLRCNVCNSIQVNTLKTFRRIIACFRTERHRNERHKNAPPCWSISYNFCC